jgi:hypothetical protein
VALVEDVPANKIYMHKADCWHRLRNTWIGGVIDQLSGQLLEILDSNLKEISPVLRVTTEVTAFSPCHQNVF